MKSKILCGGMNAFQCFASWWPLFGFQTDRLGEVPVNVQLHDGPSVLIHLHGHLCQTASSVSMKVQFVS